MCPESAAFPVASLADQYTLHNLLNCYLREVAGPAGHATLRESQGQTQLCLHLPGADADVQVTLDRVSQTGNHRYGTHAEMRLGQGPWRQLGWETFTQLLVMDLSARKAMTNTELLEQVRSSVTVTQAALTRPTPADRPSTPMATYLHSEQALTVGHRFHPAPKSREWGEAGEWAAYAPELGAAFPLHHFAVREEFVQQPSLLGHGTAALVRPLDAPVEDGFLVIPTHPWQARHLLRHPAVQAASARGHLKDLGPLGHAFSPTASIRTLMHPDVPYFYKCSLSVRITNCVRKNAEYELEGALHLSRVLQEVRPDWTARFPHLTVLLEPAFLTARLGDTPDAQRETAEGFGLILREGLTPYLDPGMTPYLAAALFGQPGRLLPLLLAEAATLTGLSPRDTALTWFAAYIHLLVPPVLHALFVQGVVFEPHLQNVVVGLRGGWPTQIFLRDLEGTKLVPGAAPSSWFGGVSDQAQAAFTYSPERGWQRVAYCLLVNHLLEAVAELSAHAPERALWSLLSDALRDYQRQHGSRASAEPVQALLAGASWPVKTNLLTRFARLADRDAGYVDLPSPLALGVYG